MGDFLDIEARCFQRGVIMQVQSVLLPIIERKTALDACSANNCRDFFPMSKAEIDWIDTTSGHDRGLRSVYQERRARCEEKT